VSWRIAAIDPGDVWCGLAEFKLNDFPRIRYSDAIDCSRLGKIQLMAAMTVHPSDLYGWLEHHARDLSAIILERFALYPWMAREQGFSEFPTAQCVGVVKYIASRVDVPVYLQDPKGNLKEGRAQAAKIGFRMKDRRLGSGRFAYRGPDFDLPGKPHRRDASAHGVRFATLDRRSPLLRDEVAGRGPGPGRVR
jgi:hypothetical protein